MTATLVGFASRVYTAIPPRTHRLQGWVGRANLVSGGPCEVAGTVKVKGTPDAPVMRRVRLYELDTARCIGETWSDAQTGAYRFEKVAGGRLYTVISHDHTNAYNAAVKDRIAPELPE
jgi:hypothetical protein